MQASPHLETVAGMKYWGTDINGVGTDVSTLPLDQIDDIVNLDLIEGSYADIDDNSLAIRDTVAEEMLVGMGDTVEVELADGTLIDMEIVAMFTDGNIFEGVLVSHDRWNTIGDQDSYDWVATSIAEGSTAEQADAAMATVGDNFPQITAQSAVEYREEISGEVDNLLYIITGFLGLAILIAFIGIVNTMALSIFERTRELGLLRAVGMTRNQMHKMVRWEAAIVSAVGALLGAVVGIVFGILVVVATPDYVLNNLAVPWVSLILLVVVAALAGLVAGFLPARRAGKLDVLDAISG